MKLLTIDKKNWNSGVKKSGESYRLTGPVEQNGADCHVFRELKEDELPDMKYRETKLSPKSIVFPQSEIMMTFTSDPSKANCNIMKENPVNYPDRAVIGIRPGDAKAMQLVKLNFDTPEYQDPYWLKAFDACTFVGLADTAPSSVDFSTSCGTGPFDESALDVLLVDCGDTYLAKVITEKGQKWIDSAAFDTPATEDAQSRLDEMKATAESAVLSTINYDRIAEKTVLELFEADHWEDTVFGCINCGTCTYTCPTCWCFDIQDEQYGTEGVRIRNWDSCMTGLFTLHGSGHNPRETNWERTRQRFMHKLKYFTDKYNQGVMCVGCGRCIKQCPANIDIREICKTMNQ